MGPLRTGTCSSREQSSLVVISHIALSLVDPTHILFMRTLLPAVIRLRMSNWSICVQAAALLDVGVVV